MGQILLKSASFIFLIALGYVLKRIGFFGPLDYKIPVKMVLNITMPCAAIVSFASYKPDFSLLLATLLCFGMNCLMLLIAYCVSKRYPRRTRAVWLNCIPGYNIGAFAMPFVQSFLSPASLVSTCLFDAGNALMCCGTTFAISKNILNGSRGLNLKPILKTLRTSVPFLAYATLLLVTLTGLHIPQALVDFVTPFSNANAFLAMIMIGMMLDLHIEKAHIKEIAGMLAIRYGIAVIAAAAIYFLMPLSLDVRQALAIAVFAPVSMVSSALAETIGGDPAVIAGTNSLSILLSVPSIIGLLAIFGVL